MNHNKPIFYLLIPALFLGTSCTQTATNTVTNTNTANENANVEVAINSNETVGNENTNITDESGEVDLSSGALAQEDWLTYTNEEYGFSFRYPEEWNLIETTSGVSMASQELVGNAYMNSMTLSITQNDFETQKKEIENNDLIDGNISLSKFNDDIQDVNFKKITAVSGTHTTAFGLDEKYYYIPLPNGSALYIEFLKPTENINFLIEDIIKTVEIT